MPPGFCFWRVKCHPHIFYNHSLFLNRDTNFVNIVNYWMFFRTEKKKHVGKHIWYKILMKCLFHILQAQTWETKHKSFELIFGYFPKGQLISKCLFGVFNFFQKTNENTSIHVKMNSFACFSEEFTVWQFAFEINWPLGWSIDINGIPIWFKKLIMFAKTES